MSEEKQTNQQEQSEGERKLKDPRDLNKRPPSKMSKDGPEHVRVQGHGIRTTYAAGSQELREEAFKENQAEDYSRNEGRTTGAGPNPYTLPTSRDAIHKEIDKLLKEREENELDNSLLSERALAAHAASAAESKDADAEVQTLGATVTNTGQKIVEKPDRVDAQDRAVLPKAGTPHEEATKVSDDPLRSDANPGAGAFNDPERES